jgi:transposase
LFDDEDHWEERSLLMMIIGWDFHPSWQQVAWLDTESGETEERKLMHASGEARQFYAGLAGPIRVGLESTGNSHWFVDMLREMGHEVWIGDAAQIRASQIRKQKTDRRDAAHILELLVKNNFPRIWTPSRQERDQRQLLIHRYKLVTLRARVKNELQHLALNQGMQKGRSLWSKDGQKQLLELPLQFRAVTRRKNLLELLKQMDQQLLVLDQAVKKAAEENEKARLLMTQPGVGPDHLAGLRADDRRCESLPARQAGGQLSGTDSPGVQFRRQAASGRDQQAGQSLHAHAAGGSSANNGAMIRSFAVSICIAVTTSRKLWPRWRRHASWLYDSTGCFAPTRRIQRSFASRAARVCPWQVNAESKG